MATARDVLGDIYKGVYKTIDSMAKIKKEQDKIKTEEDKVKIDLLKEQLKRKENFMYKIAEKEYLDPMQRAQMSQYQTQQAQGGPQIPGYVNGAAQPGRANPVGQEGFPNVPTLHGGSGVTPKGDIFSESIQPQAQLKPSKGGFTSSTPKAKDFIYNMIQKKKAKNIQLSKREQKFEEEYMFGDKKKREEIDVSKQLAIATKLARSANDLYGNDSPTIEQIQEQMPRAEQFMAGGGLEMDANLGEGQGEGIPPKVDTSKYWSDLGIETDEEAINHLVETYGVSEEEATQWLAGD